MLGVRERKKDMVVENLDSEMPASSSTIRARIPFLWMP